MRAHTRILEKVVNLFYSVGKGNWPLELGLIPALDGSLLVNFSCSADRGRLSIINSSSNISRVMGKKSAVFCGKAWLTSPHSTLIEQEYVKHCNRKAACLQRWSNSPGRIQ